MEQIEKYQILLKQVYSLKAEHPFFAKVLAKGFTF